MAAPIIFSIDDDPQVLRAIGRDLKSKFRPEYRILSTASVDEALKSLVELKNKGRQLRFLFQIRKCLKCRVLNFWRKQK